MPLHQDREEDLENLLNKGALWAVTYGDLMSYLMIFFLIMFTFSIKGKNASQGLAEMQSHFGGKKQSKALQRLQQKDRESSVAEELQKNFQVKVTEEKIQVTLEDKILFDSGAAELKPAVFPILKKFARIAETLPNTIVIEGHTDNVPMRREKRNGDRLAGYESNFELSMARAYSVLKYLIDVEKIDPRRLTAAGYGEYHPVAPNDTPESRAQNRRIEINLIRTQ